jgi:hypothetical protein
MSESLEAFKPHANKESSIGGNTKNKKPTTSTNSSKGKGSGKWCEYHEDTHNIKDCMVLQKLKAFRSGTSGTPEYSKIETWQCKSNNAIKVNFGPVIDQHR